MKPVEEIDQTIDDEKQKKIKKKKAVTIQDKAVDDKIEQIMEKLKLNPKQMKSNRLLIKMNLNLICQKRKRKLK
jgi:hypothetical protein